jgi:hypothetical protein
LEDSGVPDVIGVAYLITQDQYIHVIASEGGGTVYQDLCLSGEPVGGHDSEKVGGVCIRVRTLGSAIVRHPPPAPSQRYMVSIALLCPYFADMGFIALTLLIVEFYPQNIVKGGGNEAHLPLEYQRYLSNISVFNPPGSKWSRLGASIFVFLCGPVMLALEKLTTKSIQADGNAQSWVRSLVRWTMYIIWVVHDYLFAPIFGRGDGL